MEKQDERDIMGFEHWVYLVWDYAMLFDRILVGCGVKGGIAKVLLERFDAQREYDELVELVEDEDPQHRNIIMEYATIDRLIGAIFDFLVSRGFAGVFLSPDIWYTTWLTNSKAHREKQVGEDSQSQWDEVIEDNKKMTVFSTNANSCFSVTPRGNLLAMCYKKGDEVPVEEFTAKIIDSHAVCVASGGSAFDFLGNLGYRPVSWCHREQEFLPAKWKESDEEGMEEDIIFYAHESAMKK